jgi:hypothetical protein
MTDPLDELNDLVARLEATAARLRDGELSAQDAAGLIEECAGIAGRAGVELDRQSRALAGEAAPGQDTLL